MDTDNAPKYYALEQPEAIYRELETEQDNLYEDNSSVAQSLPKSFGPQVTQPQQPYRDQIYAEGYYSAVIPPPQKQINLDELYAPIVKNRK